MESAAGGLKDASAWLLSTSQSLRRMIHHLAPTSIFLSTNGIVLNLLISVILHIHGTTTPLFVRTYSTLSSVRQYFYTCLPFIIVLVDGCPDQTTDWGV